MAQPKSSTNPLKEALFGILLYLVRLFIVGPIDYFLDTLQAYLSKEPKPNPFLDGNYGPISTESTIFNLPVTHGSIPSDLVGEFVRNGPNSELIPKGGYHWFDGDGMLHGVRLTKDGKVSYINRQTQTNLIKAERATGSAMRIRFGEMHGVVGLFKILFFQLKSLIGLVPKDVGGTANTALVFHNKKLHALLESDVPYEIKVLADGRFETGARLHYDGRLRNMTAHPKVDPKTKEMFYFGYNTIVKPYLQYGYIDAAGNVATNFEVTIPDPIMMHDMAITEKYALLLDLSLVFHKEGILSGKVFTLDKSHQARIGVLDRYAKNQDKIVWFPVTSCQIFHTANAWEEGDEVVLMACRTLEFDLMNASWPHFTMTEWRLNMKTREVKETVICPETYAEFPQVNQNYLGRKINYAYACSKTNHTTSFDGVMKMNLSTKELVDSFYYGPNKYGGECVFVPKANAKAEDEGYLLTFVHDEKLNQSSFYVMDSTNLKNVLAIVNMPQRVPYGFHGFFISEEEIQSQLPAVRQY